MTTWSLPSLVLLVALASPERSLAQDPYGLGRFQADEKMNFVGGMDFLTSFYWRGILQENQNFIAQPWFNVTAGGSRVATSSRISTLASRTGTALN